MEAAYLCGALSILCPLGPVQNALVDPSESVHDTKYVSFINFFTTFSFGIISTCWPFVKLNKPANIGKRKSFVRQKLIMEHTRASFHTLCQPFRKGIR